MDRTPVYFIGGTFGGTSSAIIAAIVAAVLTAFGTFVVGWLIEDHKRHRDKQALAAAVRAEIATNLRIIKGSDLARFRQIREQLQAAMQRESDLHAFPPDDLAFQVTIYETCADQMGTLGKREAEDVVRLYTFLHEFRTSVNLGLSRGDLGEKYRVSRLNVLDRLSSELTTAERLQVRLQAAADRSWRPFA